jgi:hypothetical protein
MVLDGAGSLAMFGTGESHSCWNGSVDVSGLSTESPVIAVAFVCRTLALAIASRLARAYGVVLFRFFSCYLFLPTFTFSQCC